MVSSERQGETYLSTFGDIEWTLDIMKSGKGSRKHTHMYHRIRIARDTVYGCAVTGCTHYMPKHMEALLPGAKSQCWSCGNEFPLDNEALTMDEPTCRKCRNPVDDIISEFLNKGVFDN